MLFYIVAITELKRFNVQQGFSEDWLNDVTEAVLKWEKISVHKNGQLDNFQMDSWTISPNSVHQMDSWTISIVD